MSFVDIGFIALIVIFALIGLWKGFFKTVISMFGWLVSAVIAFFIAKPVATALLDIPAVRNFVLGQEGVSLYKMFAGAVPKAWLEAGDANSLGAAIGNGILGKLLAPFIDLIANGMGEAAATPGQALVMMIANGAFTVLTGVALFILIRIVMMLFTMFAKSLCANKVISGLNRFFGLLVGAAKGTFYACAVIIILSFFMSANFMSGYSKDFDKSVIAKPVATTMFDLTKGYFDNDLFQRLLEYSGFNDPVETYEPSESEQSAAAALDSLIANAAAGKTGIEANGHSGTSFDDAVDGFATYLSTAKGKINAGKVKEHDTEMTAIATAFSAGGDVFVKAQTAFEKIATYKSAANAEEPDAEAVNTALEEAKTAFTQLVEAVNGKCSSLFGTLTVNFDGEAEEGGEEGPVQGGEEGPVEGGEEGGEEGPAEGGEEGPEEGGEEEGLETSSAYGFRIGDAYVTFAM